MKTQIIKSIGKIVDDAPSPTRAYTPNRARAVAPIRPDRQEDNDNRLNIFELSGRDWLFVCFILGLIPLVLISLTYLFGSSRY